MACQLGVACRSHLLTIMRSPVLAAIVTITNACSREASDGKPRVHARPEALLTGQRPQHMRNCPSAVPTATTVGTPAPDGVNLTITSSDPDARRRIVKLAELHSNLRETIPFMPEHSGLHGGPGTIGYCPIIHAGTIVTYKQIPEGVKIHVATRRPGEVWLLQRATKMRINALAMPER